MPNAEFNEALHPSLDEAHSEKTKNTEKVQELKEKLKLADQKLYSWVKENGGKLPDWVPVLAPLRDEVLSGMKAAHAVQFQEDIETKQKFNTTKEVLEAFAKNKVESLWHHGRTGLDILMLVGTGGTASAAEAAGGAAVKGAVGEAAEKAGAKVAAEAFDKKVGEQIVNKVGELLKQSGTKGFEETLLDQVPGALKSVGGKLEAGKGKEVADTFARLYDKLGKNEITKKAMAEWLKNNETWKEIKSTASDESKRQEKIKEMQESKSFQTVKKMFSGEKK